MIELIKSLTKEKYSRNLINGLCEIFKREGYYGSTQ